MTVDWGAYEIYDPGVYGPLGELPRRDARRAYEKLMREKPARIDMLRRLLATNGVVLSESDDGIQALNDWFRANVEADPDKPGRLKPIWYSVVNDVALFLGDVLIARHPGLHWQMDAGGRRNTAYQRHVIVGFSKSPNPRLNFDIDDLVAMYGHWIVEESGSTAKLGSVEIRGVMIDIDAAVARARRLPKPDLFVDAIRRMEDRA